MNTMNKNHSSHYTLYSGAYPDIRLVVPRLREFSRREALGLCKNPLNANRRRTRSLSKPELAAVVSLGLIAVIATIIAVSTL